MSTTTTTTPKRSFMDGKRLWFILSIVFAVVAVIFVLLILRSVTATEPYYILNKNLSAREQITSNDLIEITTSANSAPITLTPGDVADGTVYARYDLAAGDILTKSNAGSLAPLSAGLPSNYVIASFKTDPSYAAGGNIKRGDYIDLYVVDKDSDTKQSHLFMQHVLVVDATADLDSATTTSSASSGDANSASDATTPVSTATVPFLFTVGVSQADAAKILTGTQYSLYATIASADSGAGAVNPVNVGSASSSIFGGTATDAGVGTDSEFSGVKSNLTKAEQANLTAQATVRTENRKVVALVKAYLQLYPTTEVSTVLGLVNYKAPSGLTVSVVGGTGASVGAYQVVVSNDSLGYTYTYDSATNTFNETNTGK